MDVRKAEGLKPVETPGVGEPSPWTRKRTRAPSWTGTPPTRATTPAIAIRRESLTAARNRGRPPPFERIEEANRRRQEERKAERIRGNLRPNPSDGSRFPRIASSNRISDIKFAASGTPGYARRGQRRSAEAPYTTFGLLDVDCLPIRWMQVGHQWLERR